MTSRRRSGWRFFIAGLLCALAVKTSMMESVDAALPPAAGPSATSQAPGGEPGVATAATSDGENREAQDAAGAAERKRKLRLAILTGGLIAVTGIALAVLTMLGGSATRRGLRRKPLAEGPPPLEPIPAERFDEQDAARGDEPPPSPSESADREAP